MRCRRESASHRSLNVSGSKSIIAALEATAKRVRPCRLATSSAPLLLKAQSLDLDFDYLLQTFRHLQIDFLYGDPELPAPLISGDQAARGHVVQRRHHKQRIPSECW